jgi:hypothetical protein
MRGSFCVVGHSIEKLALSAPGIWRRRSVEVVREPSLVASKLPTTHSEPGFIRWRQSVNCEIVLDHLSAFHDEFDALEFADIRNRISRDCKDICVVARGD